MRTLHAILAATMLLTGAGLGVLAQTDDEPRADLVATDLTAEPSEPVAGDNVTFTATVANQGEADAGAFNVTFLVDGEQVGENRTVDELRFGDQVNVTSANWTSTSGDHDVRVVVDAHDDVDEADETNNEHEDTLAVASPTVDLAVIELTPEPEQPIEGDEMTLSATVENQGNVEANATTLRFFVDDGALGEDVDVPPLAPGETLTLDSADWTAVEGDHELRAFVDPQREVDEPDEADNDLRTDVTVEPDEANLRVAELTLDPERPQPGDGVVFTANLTNDGNVAAENVTLSFQLDGEQLGNATVDELAPGASVELATDAWNATEGEHAIRAVADPQDNVTEIDEDDNGREATFTVAEHADLVPEDLVVPGDVAAGEEVTFAATIANDGSRDAENATVRFHLDGELLGETTIATMAPGEETTVESPAWNASEGEHELRLVVDADDNVTELDEDNERHETFRVGEGEHEHDHEGEEGEDTVTICHVPPGNPSARHTIEVGEPAAENHIDKHEGDHRGPCESE